MNIWVKNEGEPDEEKEEPNYKLNSDSDGEVEQKPHSTAAACASNRRRKSASLRKNIARVLGDSELQADTLEARHEEEERQRRLQLQRSLHVGAGRASSNDGSFGVVNVASASSGDYAPGEEEEEKEEDRRDVIVLDSSEDEATGEPSKKKSYPTASFDVIQIDSEGDSDTSDEEDEVKLDVAHGRVADKGCIVVNVNHPANEEDIFLAPQIAHAVKPHQVR